MRKFASFLAGALMGSLVGSTIALLLAPTSGEEIRVQLQDRLRSIQLEVQEAAATRRGELEEQLQILRTPRKSE